MKVLITGDRDYDDVEPILWILYGMTYHDKELTLVEGEARGADSLSREVAYHLNATYPDLAIKVKKYPADWKRFGKAAGPVRNRQQFDSEQPDIVVGFHDNIEGSSGTKDMLDYASKQGARCYLVSRYNNE